MGKPRLVAKPILTATARHRLAPSKLSAPFSRLGRLLMPAYLSSALAFERVEILSAERILSELHDFQSGQSRLIVAFRHPYGDEAQLMFHVFENMLPRLAKKAGRPLLRHPGLRLVHDYAVPLWGNAFIRYLLPRAGALPVYHVRSDTNSLSQIRAVLKDGPSPLGLAPEGQISYHSETLPRIELGTVRMGFWCASDLARAGRSEEVRILPISVHYRYDKRDFHQIHAIIRNLERLSGLDAQPIARKTPLPALLPRLDAIELRLLKLTEQFYRDTYHYIEPDVIAGETEADERQRRWNALLPAAITVAEYALGIDPGKEDLVQRMYRVRLEGWSRVKPEEPLNGLSKLELALADRRAGEGWFAMRHMELVDLMSYHDVSYINVASSCNDNRIVEHTINLLDLANRLMAGNVSNRPNHIRKKAYIIPGEHINLTELLPDYRVHPKKTVKIATEALATNFIRCIERVPHEENL